MTKAEAEARSLDYRVTGWLVASGLAHRALLLPASLAAGADLLRYSGGFIAIGIAAAIANTYLALAVYYGRRPKFLESWIFFAGDLGFAIALNILATLSLPHGTFLLSGRDVFWQYALGTVVVWTSSRGIPAGIAVWAGGVLLEAGMVLMNGVTWTMTGLIQAGGQVGWLTAGLIIPIVILGFAAKGTHLALTESLKAGREAEHSRVLTDLHDTALQAFAQIARRSVDVSRPALTRIDDIRRIAVAELARGTVAISRSSESAWPDLDGGLQSLADEFGPAGLAVTIRINSRASRWALNSRGTSAVLAATREALNNVQGHAGVDEAEVHVSANSRGLLLVDIRDWGCGISPEAAQQGFGLENSIKKRIHDVGGTVAIQTSPTFGTRIRMAVPAYPVEANAPLRIHQADQSHITDRLEQCALGWFVLPALVYRACLTPLQVALAVATLPRPPSDLLLCAMAGVFLMDTVLLAFARSGPVMKLFGLPQFMIVDFAVTAALNFWVALDIAPGTAALPGRQFLWGYTFGTVILWTALRGARIGLLLTALGVGIQGAALVLNDVPLNVNAAMQAGSQVAKVVAAYLISMLIARLAKRGVRLAGEAGDEAGRALERSLELLRIYTEAIAGFQRVLDAAASGSGAAETRLRQARGVALRQISELRVLLAGGGSNKPDTLRAELDTIVDSFRGTGLRVEFIATELGDRQPRAEIAAIVKSARAALQNVLEHSEAAHVVLWASDSEGFTEVVVRDQGSGLAFPEQSRLVEARISAAGSIESLGGVVKVWSETDSGTRVTIRVPHSSSEPDVLNDPGGTPQDAQGHRRRHDHENDQSLRPGVADNAGAEHARHLRQCLEEVTHDFPSA